ncbi:MAG: hypothetical protein ACYTDT_13955 [Planctomycetota bacterium]|jgi:tetratricopeptide (TPR) repeat protein
MHPDASAELVYLFRHHAMRDAMVQLLLPSERSRLHQNAMGSYGAIEENIQTARALSIHAELSLEDGHGLSDDEVKAIHAMLLKHLTKWSDLAEEGWLCEEAATALRAIARHPGVSETDSTDARYRAAYALFNAGQLEEVVRELSECEGQLPSTASAALVNLYDLKCTALMVKGAMEEAIQAASRAVELAEQLDDLELLAQSLETKGAALERLGRLEESLEHRERES